MPRYRQQLPQLSGAPFVTDGGMETTMIFHHGIDLPEFASFLLLERADGVERIHDYFQPYLEIAKAHQASFILESMTWRASRDWGAKLGYSPQELAAVNRKSIEVLVELRQEYEQAIPHIVIGGCLGPRGDGYNPQSRMSATAAAEYHREQIATFRETEADLVTAFTLPYSEEAIGIVHAAQAESMPVAISFTVETDGRLPSGETLAAAITAVDEATNQGAAYFMVNCAHPTHFAHVLESAPWAERIRAVRANASTKSHAELDASTELDAGHPEDLGRRYIDLAQRLPNLNVFGGCCGTDHRHVAEICRSILPSPLPIAITDA